MAFGRKHKSPPAQDAAGQAGAGPESGLGPLLRNGITMQADRLASTFLLVGPPGVGKRTFALKLAQALLCQQAANASLDPCGECESCRLWAAGNHPDLLQVAKPADKSFIPIDLLLGSKEKRMREGLCHDLSHEIG